MLQHQYAPHAASAARVCVPTLLEPMPLPRFANSRHPHRQNLCYFKVHMHSIHPPSRRVQARLDASGAASQAGHAGHPARLNSHTLVHPHTTGDAAPQCGCQPT